MGWRSGTNGSRNGVSSCRVPAVIAWNWTDTRERPYPQPDDEDGFRAALLDLRIEERTWLLNHCWESENPNA